MEVLGSHHLLLIPQHTVTCYDLHRKPDVQGYDKRRKKRREKERTSQVGQGEEEEIGGKKRKKKPNLQCWLKRRKK